MGTQQPLERGGLPTEPPLREGHATHPEPNPRAVDPGADEFDQVMQVYAAQLATVFDSIGRGGREGR